MNVMRVHDTSNNPSTGAHLQKRFRGGPVLHSWLLWLGGGGRQERGGGGGGGRSAPHLRENLQQVRAFLLLLVAFPVQFRFFVRQGRLLLSRREIIKMLKAVLGIRVILVRIWIRLLSSVTLRMQKKKFSLSFSDN
jgi:hypothetical protein